jgi:hypothetical protein
VAKKAINAWIGNTAHLRRRHYHAVRPEDWAAVTGKAAHIPARVGEFRSRQPFMNPTKKAGGADELGNSLPPAGIIGSLSFPRKTTVFGGLVPKSYPVSAQAVALGGDPLGNETATVAAEDEHRSEAQGRRSNTSIRSAASPKAGGHPVIVGANRPPSPRPQTVCETGLRAFTDTSRSPTSVRPEPPRHASRPPRDTIPPLELCPSLGPPSALGLTSG